MQLRESFPLRTYMGLSLLGVGFGLVGAIGGAAVASNAMRVRATIPELAIAVTSEPVSTSTSLRVNTEAADAPSNDVGFIITTRTGNYFVLPAIDAAAVVAHGTTAFDSKDGVEQVTEPLRGHDLTADIRAWRDVRVTVDGTCTDTLRDFTLISQLTGDPGYAADTDGAQDWTAKAVKDQGQKYVAAKLEHCDGTYARATTAPPIVAFTDVKDGSHIAQAEKTLLASAVAKDVRDAYLADLPGTTWTTWRDLSQVQSLESTDPRTGTSWVMIHVNAELACGGPDINFYGLYRVDGDRLVPMSEVKTDNLGAITSLVDLDGDGVPELLGNGWISPTHAFYSAEMEPLVSYDVPFFGCPC